MKAPWSFGVDILITQGKYVVTDVIFKERKEGDYINPSFNLDSNNTQQLMDQLWVAGFRPSEGSGSAGALKATENHLQDMRNIIFSSIDFVKKEKK